MPRRVGTAHHPVTPRALKVGDAHPTPISPNGAAQWRPRLAPLGGRRPPSAAIGVSSGFSLSDAIVLAEAPANFTVIDNGDAGYTQTGFSTQSSGDAFSGDQAFNSTANNGGFATWTFDNLVAGFPRTRFVTGEREK